MAKYVVALAALFAAFALNSYAQQATSKKVGFGSSFSETRSLTKDCEEQNLSLDRKSMTCVALSPEQIAINEAIQVCLDAGGTYNHSFSQCLISSEELVAAEEATRTCRREQHGQGRCSATGIRFHSFRRQ